MRTALSLLSCLLLVPAVAAAKDEGTGPEVVRLSVRPAAEPRPALKYALIPPPADLTPGNAALLYYRMLDRIDGKDDAEKLDKWLRTAPADLPRKDVQVLLGKYKPLLEETRRAARRAHCDWGFPIREEGLQTVLPPLTKFRHLGKVLALQARFEIAEGRCEEALRTLQTGFAFARHQADAQLLINCLIGAAIADVMLQEVQAVAEAPEGPNLYWALAGLGSPVIDLQRGVWMEAEGPYIWFPALQAVRGGKPTSEEAWRRALDQIGQFAGGDISGRLGPVALALKLYPHAKRYLAEHGYSDAKIAAMPVRQALAMYMIETFEQIRDEVFKWYLLPYPQAAAGLQQADRILARAHTDPAMPGFPLTLLLPAMGRAYYMQVRLDRKVAALRCIEAVRMYAAGHDGRPPERLEDIQESPVPANPMTGRPFGYKAAGNSFTLEVAGPADAPGKDAERYEVTLIAK